MSHGPLPPEHPGQLLQRLRPAGPARSTARGSLTSTPTRRAAKSLRDHRPGDLARHRRQGHPLRGGVGTGGTITGTGRYLGEISGGKVKVVGVDPEGVYSGGTGRPYLVVEGVGEDFWPAAYDATIPDEIIAVSDADCST